MLFWRMMDRSGDIEEKLLEYLRGLMNHETGLLSSHERDPGGSVSDNALAAIVFLRAGDVADAERILGAFERFCRCRTDAFEGLPVLWESTTGLPRRAAIVWERDSALVLLAELHHCHANQRIASFALLRVTLAEWLLRKSMDGGHLDAESVATMYAALRAYSRHPQCEVALRRLETKFFSHGVIPSSDYAHVLSHIMTGALVFGDLEGLQHISAFRCTAATDVGPRRLIVGYSETVGAPSISVVQSARLVLAARLWPKVGVLLAAHLEEGLEAILWQRLERGDLTPGEAGWFLLARWGGNPYEVGREGRI